MHEMTGVHETALGQVQPISNTSGVALAIQFQPLMKATTRRSDQYGEGLLSASTSWSADARGQGAAELAWDPDPTRCRCEAGQLNVLDPADPITYQTVRALPAAAADRQADRAQRGAAHAGPAARDRAREPCASSARSSPRRS
jgi:hypothetical protein